MQSANVGTKLDRWCYWWMHKANLCAYHFWCCALFLLYFNGFNVKRNITDIFLTIRLMHLGHVTIKTHNIHWLKLDRNQKIHKQWIWYENKTTKWWLPSTMRSILWFNIDTVIVLNASKPRQAKPNRVSSQKWERKNWIWIEYKLHWAECWAMHMIKCVRFQYTVVPASGTSNGYDIIRGLP